MFKEILLLANGYPEYTVSTAINLSSATGAGLSILYIIDSNWTDILGDEWISGPKTRREFINYIDKEFQARAEADVHTVAEQAKKHRIYSVKKSIKKGIPEKTILSFCENAVQPALLLIPYPPPASEYTLKIKPDKIIKKTKCPVLAVPEANISKE